MKPGPSFPVLLARLALPAQLGGDDAEEGALLAVGQHLARLPPLVVARVHHVQDVAVREGQPARRKAVVLVSWAGTTPFAHFSS